MIPELEQLIAEPIITIAAWTDSTDPAYLVPVCDRRVEQWWLPVIGPTALLALRRMGARAQAGPYRQSLPVLAWEMGVGQNLGRNGALIRTLDRLVNFNLARPFINQLQVRVGLAQPARHHRKPWPPEMQEQFAKEAPWPILTTE